MKLKISNRADAFFGLFSESAENLRMAAELLQDLIGDYRDVELEGAAHSRPRARGRRGDARDHPSAEHARSSRRWIARTSTSWPPRSTT